MPRYVEKALQNLQHNNPPNMQHQRYPNVPPNYGAKTLYSIPLDDFKPLDKEGNKFITQVTVTLLY